MKTIIVNIALCLMVLSSFSAVAQANFTQEDRVKLIEQLKMTETDLMMAVNGLSEEQLNFKPSDSSWSIANCVEHLAISENMMMGAVQKSLETQADASKRSELKMTDDDIMGFITNRSTKVKTSEAFEPTESFGSYIASLEVFKGRRNKSILFAQGTTKDLRNHYCDFPFGKIDAAQCIMFMAGHTNRHTQQIAEIKGSAGFPEY